MMGASCLLASLRNTALIFCVQRSHATHMISLGWRCLCQLASVLACALFHFWGARSRDLIVCLSVVKRVHPVGNDTFFKSFLVHTTGARLNEMLGFVASFPPRPDGSLLPQILVERNFLPFQIRSGSYLCVRVRRVKPLYFRLARPLHACMESEHPPLTAALKLFHTVC